MALLTNILAWWSTARVPTVDQRNQTFSSFRHKDDPIPIGDVEGLEDIINNFFGIGADEFTAPSNFGMAFGEKTLLEKIAIVPTADIVLSIGTVPGGNNILDAQAIPANNTDLFVFEKYFHTGVTLYVSGVTVETYFKFFKRA